MISHAPVFSSVNGNTNIRCRNQFRPFLKFSMFGVIRRDPCFVVVELHVFVNNRSWLEAHYNKKWTAANTCYSDVDRYMY